jgi:hypothetical protein
MKIHSELLFFATLFCAASLIAQERPVILSATNTTGDYASDVLVVQDAQKQMLAQARQMLGQIEEPQARQALATAIKEMERSATMLEEAKRTPDKLPAALSAQQAAYAALLKLVPREFRITRSRNGSQNGGAQPNRRELDQLQMADEENRYETERQATATPDREQSEQLRTADRLKQLARRQQDLNDRLRELQIALQEARTDPQREEIERQLKRLRDEERQMLADMDDLRQDLAQSPNNNSQSQTRQQLDRTRSEMQRTAQELEQQSVSRALAAGTRAQQSLQNLKDDLRRQTSSQFSGKMRQLRSQVRELAGREDEIAQGLQSLNGAEHKSLDDSAERQQLLQKLSQQQSGLTNLLAGMRTVTEQAENTEPLVSKQLYDLLRRADQMRTDNLLQTSQELVDRGFLPQASEAEQSARQNINELRQGVERAAEQVLGNETEVLRYAQKELDDLTRQVGNDLSSLETNAASQVSPSAPSGSGAGTNALTGMTAPSGSQESQTPNPNSPSGRSGSRDTAAAQNEQQQGAQGQSGAEENASGRNGQRQGAAQSQANEGRNSANANNGNDAASANPSEQAGNNGSQAGNDTSAQPQNGNRSRNGSDSRDRLRQWVQQLGDGGNGGAFTSGPIMGNNFVDWSDRVRDVEEVLDAQDLRNRLATVRERVAGLRAEYRQSGRVPQPEIVRTEILTPMTQVRVWLQEELARRENAGSLVPLDRDPVPDKYSEQVRHYYEKLGSAQ